MLAKLHIFLFQLLINHGLVYQSGAGLFTLLPLAQRALNKLQRIVDEHMHAIGANEISMPTLTPAELWKKTGNMHFNPFYIHYFLLF